MGSAREADQNPPLSNINTPLQPKEWERDFFLYSFNPQAYMIFLRTTGRKIISSTSFFFFSRDFTFLHVPGTTSQHASRVLCNTFISMFLKKMS